MALDWLGAAIGGISSIFGQSSANASAEEAADKQMKFQNEQALANRDFVAHMSKSAHQYEVADLRAAGLNPILSATGGNGAAVVGGSVPSGASYTPVNTLANVGKDFSSAAALKQQSELQKSQIDVNRAELVNKAASASATSAQTANINADTQIKLSDAKYRADMLKAGLLLSGTQNEELKAKISNMLRTNSLIDAQILSEGARAGMYNTSSAQLNALIAKHHSDIDVNEYTKREIGARTGEITARTQGSLYDLERKKHEAAYQQNSSLAPYLPYVRNIIDTINPFHFK